MLEIIDLIKGNDSGPHEKSKNISELLLHFAEENQTEACEAILEEAKGMEDIVNGPGGGGPTPLHYSCIYHNAQLTESLWTVPLF